MSIWEELAGAFTGSSARNDINAGADKARAETDSGLASANADYTRGASRFDSYAKGGGDAFDRYMASLGVKGVDAQRQVQGEYMADPIQAAIMDRVTRSNTRAYTAQGMNNSGASTKALTNSLMDRWSAYQQQLAGAGNTGMQAAGSQASFDQMMADAEIGASSQKAGIATGQATAVAGTRAAPLNNLLNIASLGVQSYTGKPATKY